MIYFKYESYQIVGAALAVYNTLGPGFLEQVYQEALEIEFTNRGIPFEREKEIKIQYNGIELNKTYKADFICYDKIIVELKAVASLENVHRAQVANYLRAANLQLGLLMNFGSYPDLEKERIVK